MQLQCPVCMMIVFNAVGFAVKDPKPAAVDLFKGVFILRTIACDNRECGVIFDAFLLSQITLCMESKGWDWIEQKYLTEDERATQ